MALGDGAFTGGFPKKTLVREMGMRGPTLITDEFGTSRECLVLQVVLCSFFLSYLCVSGPIGHWAVSDVGWLFGSHCSCSAARSPAAASATMAPPWSMVVCALCIVLYYGRLSALTGVSRSGERGARRARA